MDEKKIAIVTGGARGIGEATVKVFARNGYAVVALDVLAEEGRRAAHEIVSAGEDCLFMECDVADEARVASCVGAVGDTYGRVDALLNVAGVVLVKPFEQITWAEYRRTVDVNLGGTFLACKYVLPYMKRQRGGVIVNMASVSGHVGQTDHVMYGATKGAIIAMTRALAWEMAPYNIRVVSISPGSVDTPMLRGDIELESTRTGVPFEVVRKEREAEQAFKRWADPMEIAEPLYFLASDAASFITGSDLLVDCGWVAR